MPKLVVSIDGVVTQEVQLTQARTTLGRRPYNDIVIDNLAVSGEHAVLQMSGAEVQIEDLRSTNGTYVNGQAVARHALQHNDSIEIGKYKIRFLAEPAASSALAAVRDPGPALLKVRSGVAVGREVSLVKEVTTLGKPGGAVALVTRQPEGYLLSHLEGGSPPLLNGQPLAAAGPVLLRNGDVFEVAETRLQFVQG